MYAHGEGVPEDDAEAVRWYRLAAEQGDVTAQYSLGVMYATGEGVSEDLAITYARYNVAGAQGMDFANESKNAVAERMTRAQIARAQELSQEYWSSYVLPFQ